MGVDNYNNFKAKYLLFKLLNYFTRLFTYY